MKVKGILKRAAAGMLVVFCLGLVLYNVDRTVRRKDQNGILQFDNFYKLEKNSLDVLVVGSSHVYANVNPAVWWSEYGITGYILGGMAQPTWNSYYAIQEALKYQRPKVIVVDIIRTVESREFADDANVLENILGMRPSYLKWQAVKASVEKEKALSFFLGYPTYHDRYLALEKEDCYGFKDSVMRDNFKGYQALFEQYGEEILQKDADLTLERDLNDKSKTYLLKIIQLCSEEGIPLIFVNSPMVNTSPEEQAAVNGVRKIAQEYGIPFIDGDLNYAEVGIDSEKYFADATHLNYWGSKLYTHYLGEYLISNFQFEDKRNDPQYQSWQWNAICEERLEREAILTRGFDLESYLNFCMEDGYECLVICDNQQEVAEHSIVWKKFIYSGKPNVHDKSLVGEFVCVGDKEGQIEDGKLILDDIEYSLTDSTFMMIVYDNVLGRIVDVICSDGMNLYRP